MHIAGLRKKGWTFTFASDQGSRIHWEATGPGGAKLDGWRDGTMAEARADAARFVQRYLDDGWTPKQDEAYNGEDWRPGYGPNRDKPAVDEASEG